MDELAKIYFELNGQNYRIKVFEKTVWIEAQPNGQNMPLPHSEWSIWSEETNTWHIGKRTALVDTYRAESGITPSSDPESETVDEITLITDYDEEIGLYYFLVKEGDETLHFRPG